MLFNYFKNKGGYQHEKITRDRVLIFLKSVPQILNVDYDWLKLPNELFENNGAHGAA
jgi:hypothetical protein